MRLVRELTEAREKILTLVDAFNNRWPDDFDTQWGTVMRTLREMYGSVTYMDAFEYPTKDEIDLATAKNRLLEVIRSVGCYRMIETLVYGVGAPRPIKDYIEVIEESLAKLDATIEEKRAQVLPKTS